MADLASPSIHEFSVSYSILIHTHVIHRLPKDPPLPAPTSLDDASVIPLVYSSFLAVLTYTWINPIMVRAQPQCLIQ